MTGAGVEHGSRLGPGTTTRTHTHIPLPPNRKGPRIVNRDTYVEALLRERRGYVIHGQKDRVAAVDAELEKLGAALPAEGRAKPRSKERTVAKPSEVRRGK